MVEPGTSKSVVHRAGQEVIRSHQMVNLPPLPQLIATSEALAALGIPTGSPPPKGKAIAPNTSGLDDAEAELAIELCAAREAEATDQRRHATKSQIEKKKTEAEIENIEVEVRKRCACDWRFKPSSRPQDPCPSAH